MFVVYIESRSGPGYFLIGEGDDIREVGGTNLLAEARKFDTARSARKLGEAYARASHAKASVVLKLVATRG